VSNESPRDEQLGRLAEELRSALAADEQIDPQTWAERFDLETADVEACLRTLRALESCLGEDPKDGLPELRLPSLPDSFEIEGELGRGGMGVVYRARQTALDRTVAVKVLRPGELQFGAALQRFRDEARSLARLRHRHIVAIHDVGETLEGLLWFAMDLVEGHSLADEIHANGPLTPSRAVRVLAQVTSAIAHAHAQGIVHRDLKPQNVLIDDAGDAYVVDFGLARDAAAGSHTLSGELLGTPAYMSPEQALGESTRIGEATDIWALGALLYECLTGRGPFAGKALHETIRAIIHEDPPAPRTLDARVPRELEAVCLKAMRKRPEQRYPAALALGEELERFSEGRGVLARRPSPLRRLSQKARQYRTRVAIGTMATLSLALIVSILLVPKLLRQSRITDARLSLSAGYAGAALEPLRALAEEERQENQIEEDSRDFDLLLLQCLHAHAAELHHDGNLSDARSIFREAQAIAARGWRNGGLWHLRMPEAERNAWRFEIAVSVALRYQLGLGKRKHPGT
jgi:serine/threonine protein kinase